MQSPNNEETLSDLHLKDRRQKRLDRREKKREELKKWRTIAGHIRYNIEKNEYDFGTHPDDLAFREDLQLQYKPKNERNQGEKKKKQPGGYGEWEGFRIQKDMR